MRRIGTSITALMAIPGLLYLAWHGSPASARERQWYQYENAYFVAYSDASEKKVRAALRDLEFFREAVIQLTGLEVPAGAAKTQVLIFNSARDFRKTTDDRNLAAYMTAVAGLAYIVMPASGVSHEARITIRHEYTHVLQAYSAVRQPPWYREGFAEFMSGVEVSDSELVIGDFAGRGRAIGSLVDWNELIADEFSFNEITSARLGSNAYLQAWLLTHYLTLGDDMTYNANLIHYLKLYATGTGSSEAFDLAFGTSPDVLGPGILKKYSKAFYAMRLTYTPRFRSLPFERSEADPDAIRNKVDMLKIRNGVRSD